MTVPLKSPAKNDLGNWTFDLIYNHLQLTPEIHRLKSIEEFLTANKSLITIPLLFQVNDKDTLPSGKTFELRGASYEINEPIKKDSEEISEILSISKLEILRVISQISKRSSSEISDATKNKQLEDKERITKAEIHSLYIDGILRERTTIVKLINFLLTHNDIPELQSKFSTLIYESTDFIPSVIQFIEQLVGNLTKESSDSKFKTIIIAQTSSTIVELLKLLISIFIKVSIPSTLVTQWFKALECVQFFHSLKSTVTEETYQEITSLSSIVSLLSLGLNTNDDYFDFTALYLKDPEAIITINNVIVDAPKDAIVLYSWSVLLFLVEESVLSQVFGEGFDIEQYSTSFATKAAELNVFGVIEQTHKTLIYDTVNAAILSSFVIAVSPFIQLTDEISHTILSIFRNAPNSFIEKFFVNDNVQNMIQLSKVKFPEVIIPYLRILSINGSYAHSELSQLDTYMSVLSPDVLTYDNDLETDTITLKDGHYLKLPFEQSKDALLYLPPSTQGKFMPTADQNLEAAIFKYRYNGWSLLGRILQNITLFEDQNNELLLTILELITNTVLLTDADTTSDIFEKLSSFIDDGDILDLLLKLFEQSLHQSQTENLTQLTKLLTALLSTFPQIVWSHLVRSDLLERRGRGGLIAHILGGVETVNGDYKFTVEVLKLFNELVNHSVTGEKELDSYKVEVLPKFVNFANQVFESFMHWNYKDKSEKYIIGSSIVDSYSKILYSVYGVDPETKPSHKVTGVLASSAERIIGSFTSPSPDVRIIKPILTGIDSLEQRASHYESSGNVGFHFNQWISGILELSKLVVAIRSVNNFKPSSLERSLFAKTPELVSIYNQFSSLRSSILQLLTHLVKSNWAMNDTPSLLSHLGEIWTSTLVLSLADDLQFQYGDFTAKKFLYAFMSGVIEGNQRGLAMIFLTGHGPHNVKVGGKPLLRILKEKIQSLDYYPESVSIRMVDTLALALNSWSLQEAGDINGDEDITLVKTLIKKLVDSSKEQVHSLSNDQIIKECYKYKLNSRIAEICALLVFTSTSAKNQNQNISNTIICELNADHMLELAKPLYFPSPYRGSLHANLCSNFEQKWPELKLQKFIRVPLTLNTTTYGEGSVYELRLLDAVIGSNPYWIGSDLTSGYRNEVISASLNLQYVSSQIECAKSWGALLTAYAKNFKVKSGFIEIIGKLLDANIKEGVNVSLLRDVYRVRVELAFFLLFSISKNTEITKETNKKILELALQLITSMDVNFLVSLSQGKSEIYRPLLRIVSNCLSSAKGDTELVESLSGELLEFVEIVLAKGTTVLLDSVQTVHGTPEVHGKIEDIFLIISVVKALLAAKPTSIFTSKLSKLLTDSNTLRSVLNLYSSSHLLKVNEDYIFSELSLTFITELISSESIAEQLLQSGLFSILIQSPISALIQEGSVHAHTQPRLHNIWRNGLLAIVLILLSKFGGKVLPECSAFISYFTKQFKSSIDCWSGDSFFVTIPALEELEQVILLEKALETLYYQFGQSSFSTSFKLHHEDGIEIVPGLDTDKGRKSLQGSLNHLLAHPKFLTSKVIPTCAEERSLFEGEDKLRTQLMEKIVAQINEIIESLDD